MWLKDGDQNIKFFHGKAKQRRKTNTISKLKDEFGAWKYGWDRFEEILRFYFEGILSSTQPRGT